MISISFSARAVADIQRFVDVVMEHDLEAAESVAEGIITAVEVLRRHPLIGRPVENGLRELIISRGRTGYIGLYEFKRVRAQVIVHKLRHQLEAGYKEE